MKKFSQKIFHIFAHIFAIFAFIFLTNEAVFASHPFTDVKPTDAYHDAVSELFDARIISDDGSHLFRPDEPMNRDFFVSLTTAIGCKECLTPTSDDLIKFQKSPFIDLPKTNQFYYCIAHSADEGVTQGYNIDPNIGSVSCENGENFSSSPFCADNKISRIEAAAMLLRRAKLWDDNKNNGNFEKKENFSDVSEYWYGYAQKSLEIGILTKKSDNSIRQDEKISRGEFAVMAAKILAYTQCNTSQNDNVLASYIEVRDSSDTVTTKTVFNEGEKFTLIPKTETGKYTYSWTAKNPNGETITSNDENFDGSKLPPGTWFVDVKIIDPNTGKTVSNPSVTITVIPKQSQENPDGDDDNDGIKNKDDMCPTVAWPKENNGCPKSAEKIGVSIIGTPLVTHIGDPITFTPQITGTTATDLVYKWDFGDGTHTTKPGTQTHPYSTPGTKTVTLTVTNPQTGNTAQTTMIVRITDDKDSDSDGILDSEDKCPLVKWPKSNNGCPEIKTPDYGCSIREIYSGNPNCQHTSLSDPLDSDGDGLKDPKDPNNPQNNNSNNTGSPEDHCIHVPGPVSNLWCPINGDGDDDNDGIKNRDDRCPNIPGTIENHGCPNNSGNNTDTDGDGVPDHLDSCPQVRGLKEWQGCPNPELYKDISKNVCLLNKLNTNGLITWVPACNACPCINQVDISTQLRECDIVFPSILSRDKNTIYSRGNFYLIQ